MVRPIVVRLVPWGKLIIGRSTPTFRKALIWSRHFCGSPSTTILSSIRSETELAACSRFPDSYCLLVGAGKPRLHGPNRFKSSFWTEPISKLVRIRSPSQVLFSGGFLSFFPASVNSPYSPQRLCFPCLAPAHLLLLRTGLDDAFRHDCSIGAVRRLCHRFGLDDMVGRAKVQTIPNGAD